MKVSIIIPVYNSAQTIKKCVGSLVNQTYHDIEILLVNDGSKDNSKQICEDLIKEDTRIRFIDCKVNHGAGLARNEGLKLMSGDWVTFCDSDDHPDKNWINDFILGIRDDAQLVVQGFYCDNWPDHDSISNKIIAYNGFGDRDYIVERLCRKNVFGYLWCKLYRTSIIKDNILFFKNIIMIEDEMFNIEYLKYVKNISCVDKCNYYYNRPDFYEKYGKVDNFKANIDMFNASCDAFGDKSFILKDMYLSRATDWLLSSYRKHEKDKLQKLSVYCKTVASYIRYAKTCRKTIKYIRYFLFSDNLWLTDKTVILYVFLLKILGKGELLFSR